MKIVIYARYSSHSQTEQSIEGQLQVCYEYAKNNGHTVIAEYIDRAQSGTSDNRTDFQRMIADSDKHLFEAVLVYQLDRFARNRYDSAINKAKLKKNGIRVLSARENITDDASGILVEGILESMAEYYSVELSQKIRRGMDINAEKCLSNGSNPGLGYTVDADRRFHINPETAPIVREIFEMYAEGKTTTEIITYLNGKQLKTSQGNPFNKNSLHRLLKNKRYIGYYIYKDTITPNAMPRIIDDNLFYRVQDMLDRNHKAPARKKAKDEYLLTTKLFCGYCNESMIGYGGTGKSGRVYHYYACKNARKKHCDKKIIKKDVLENQIIQICFKLLNDKNIQKLSKTVADLCKSDLDTASIKRIKSAIQESDKALDNLWKALEYGQSVEMITERIQKRQEEKKQLEAQLSLELSKLLILTETQITGFLYKLKAGNVDNLRIRRSLINIFINRIYLYDDKVRIVLNGCDRPVELDNSLLSDLSTFFESVSEALQLAEGSDLSLSVPPNKLKANPFPLGNGFAFSLNFLIIDGIKQNVRDDKKQQEISAVQWV